jgi:hypothetical protein
MRSSRGKRLCARNALDDDGRSRHSSTVIRAILFPLRCALVALLALSIVSAQPAMMLVHAGDGMQHDCGMSMKGHHESPPAHHCSSTTDGACCHDCVCACVIGSGMSLSNIVLTATYTHPIAIASRPAEVVRVRQPLGLRLPPPIGPPLTTRS